MTTNKLPPSALTFPNFAGQQYNHWIAMIPPGHAFGEMFSAAYWAHVAARLRLFDVVRAVARDGSFDVNLTVRGRPAGGAIMELWPKFPKGFGSQAEAEATAEAEAARPQVVPILPNGRAAVRVDFTEATKYRVISINGEPLQSGIATEAEANAIMARYLAELRLRLPTEAELAEAAEKRQTKQAERDAADAKRKAKRQAA
jgi:hypothetical protein